MANTNSKLKDLLHKVRLALADAAPAADTPPAPGANDKVEIKSKEGDVYHVAKLEVGEAVTEINPDGTETPAPDGEIEAEDGTKITVKDGKIQEVQPAAAAGDAPPETPAPVNNTTATFNAEDFVSKEVFTALQTKFETALQTIAGLTETLNKNKGQVTAMFELVEAIANESDATPTNKAKTQTFSSKTSEKDEAKAKLKQAFSEAK